MRQYNKVSRELTVKKSDFYFCYKKKMMTTTITPEQHLRYDIRRLMVEYKEKYDKLKAFKTDFNPNFIQCLKEKINNLHTCSNGTLFNYPYCCCCDVTSYLAPSLDSFINQLTRFLKAFEQVKIVCNTLTDFYKKVCDCCETMNKKKINIPDLRNEVKVFYHLSLTKAFEKAFTEMNNSIVSYDIFMNNDILYNRLGIEIY